MTMGNKNPVAHVCNLKIKTANRPPIIVGVLKIVNTIFICMIRCYHGDITMVYKPKPRNKFLTLL